MALPYASKVFGFLQDLNIDMPPMKLVNSGRLIAYIDRAWDGHAALQAQINAALPSFKKARPETNMLAVQLLTQVGAGKQPSRQGPHTGGEMPPLKRPPHATLIRLPPRDALDLGEPDVLITGGGPAGLGAALGARARAQA